MSSENKVILDSNSFKALSSETRRLILKQLGERKKTPTEIASSIGVKVQSLEEHLMKLEKAGLVRKCVRQGHKAVYFELTEKGKSILNPEKKSFWFLLTASILLVLLSVQRLLLNALFPVRETFSQAIDSSIATISSQKTIGELTAESSKKAAEVIVESTPIPSPQNLFPQAHAMSLNSTETILLYTGVILFIASLYFLFRKNNFS